MNNSNHLKTLPKGAVDSHAHVIGNAAVRDMDRHPTPFPPAMTEIYLDILQTHGVQFGLLTAPSFYGTDNTVLLNALKQSGERLKGTVIVDPAIPESELALMQAAGVCGLRLNWIRLHQDRPDLNSVQYKNLLSKAKNLGLHIEVYLEGEYLPQVLPVLRTSGVDLVIDHFGHPAEGVQAALSEGFRSLLDALDHGRTWVKLSAPYRLRDCNPKALAQEILSRQYGAARVLWATDWPWVGHGNSISYQQCIDWLFEWVPDQNQRNQILVDTPHKLFKFNRSVLKGEK